MMTRSRFTMPMLAPLVVLACQSATEPAQLPVVLATQPALADSLPATIHADGARIVIRGIVGTPDPCYSFAARALTRADTLDVRLEAQSAGVTCIQIPGSFRYDLTVQAVPSGTWWVRLGVSRRGSPAIAQLVAGPVTVP